MKQIHVITLLLLLSSSLAQSQKVARNGWYFLAEKASDGLSVTDIDSEDVFAIEPKPVLAVTDFKNIRIVTRDFEPNDMKAIEIQLNKAGRKKWNDAKKRIAKTKESVVFVYNDKIYLEKFIYGASKTLTSFIDLMVDQKYMQEIFDAIKKEMDN